MVVGKNVDAEDRLCGKLLIDTGSKGTDTGFKGTIGAQSGLPDWHLHCTPTANIMIHMSIGPGTRSMEKPTD